MSDFPAPTPDQVTFLAQLVLETRAHPDAFARGARLLESQFNFEEIIRKREEKRIADRDDARRVNEETVRRTRATQAKIKRRELKKSGLAQLEINAAARGVSDSMKDDKMPILAVYEEEAARGVTEHERKYGPRSLPRDEALRWTVELPWTMSRAEAEAACLIAAFFYDENPVPNPALPPTFQAIPWAHPSTVESDEEVLGGRWLHVFFHGLNPQLVQVAQLAYARVRSYPQSQKLEPPAAGSAATGMRPIPPPPSERGTPLSEQEWIFVKVLVDSPPDVWLTSTRICELYDERKPKDPGPADNDFRSRIVPRLDTWGLEHGGKRGYRFPVDAVARRVVNPGG
jgi:hypothetical protein